MYSATAVTTETYDLDLAVSELVEQIRKAMPETKNRCGMVFMDPGYDGKALIAKLKQAFGCDIIGATSAAMLSSDGYHATCALLLMIGGNDCAFGIAITPALDEPSAREGLAAAYTRALSRLGGAAPVMMVVLSAASPGCTEDARLKILQELSGGIPIFGGVAADHFEFAHARVFGEDASGPHSMVMLLMSGNLRPKFVMRNVARKHLARSRITACVGTCVHTIDGISAHAYMIREGADPTNAMSLHFTPLLVEAGTRDNDDAIICRPFVALDKDTGCGTTLLEVPEGSAVTVQAIDSTDIVNASREAMARLLQKINADEDTGYVYSTIIAISCAARHMVLAVDKEREAVLAHELFPAGLTVGGFYSFGEFCPVAVAADGKADNRLHNLTLGLCAL